MFDGLVMNPTKIVAQGRTQRLEVVMIMTVLMEWEFMVKLMNMHIFNMEMAMI